MGLEKEKLCRLFLFYFYLIFYLFILIKVSCKSLGNSKPICKIVRFCFLQC